MVSMGAVVGVMVVLCFVLAMLCVFMRRSSSTAASSEQGRREEDEEEVSAEAAAAAAAALDVEAASHGLDERTVQSLPLYQLPPLHSQEPCPICLSSFLQGQFVRVLPACSHTFHLLCIDQWFSSHSNCPICRSSISLSPRSPNTFSAPNYNTIDPLSSAGDTLHT